MCVRYTSIKLSWFVSLNFESASLFVAQAEFELLVSSYQPREQAYYGLFDVIMGGEQNCSKASTAALQLISLGAVNESSIPQDGGFTSALGPGVGLVPSYRRKRWAVAHILCSCSKS